MRHSSLVVAVTNTFDDSRSVNLWNTVITGGYIRQIQCARKKFRIWTLSTPAGTSEWLVRPKGADPRGDKSPREGAGRECTVQVFALGKTSFLSGRDGEDTCRGSHPGQGRRFPATRRTHPSPHPTPLTRSNDAGLFWLE